MSTHDVPGAKAENKDELTMGCWAEHEDGSLVFVEGVEGGDVVYSMFDVQTDPPVEYRDAMPRDGFVSQFSWPTVDDIEWTWHDKTSFPWDRVMENFPSGTRAPSAAQTLSAAQRVAQSLDLQAQELRPVQQRRAGGLLKQLVDEIKQLDI